MYRNGIKRLVVVVIILISTIILCCCAVFQKKYEYIETVETTDLIGRRVVKDKEPEKIRARNDEEAYMEAFKKFCISKKVSNFMIEDYGVTVADVPLSFALYNDKGIDITRSIDFNTKSEQEEKMAHRIFSMELGESSSEKQDESRVDSNKVKELLPFFSQERDEFSSDGSVMIQPKSAPRFVNENGIYLYFYTSNDGVGPLRFRYQYYADDWLFIKGVKFAIDDKIFEFIPSKMERDHGEGMIWEWFDEKIGARHGEMIETLTDAESAKMKLFGSQYTEVVTITQKQIRDIKRTVELYRAMGGRISKKENSGI